MARRKVFPNQMVNNHKTGLRPTNFVLVVVKSTSYTSLKKFTKRQEIKYLSEIYKTSY